MLKQNLHRGEMGFVTTATTFKAKGSVLLWWLQLLHSSGAVFFKLWDCLYSTILQSKLNARNTV